MEPEDWPGTEGAVSESQESASPPVLVAVITDPRDLRIAREEGWYRIPVKHAPRRLAAEYLAFYQTRAFGDEKWAVRYYAPIRQYRLVTRLELLPDEPDHPRARDQYYKVDIGPLECLPRPIPSRRLRRITFIMTNLQRLLSAEEINDLWQSDSRQELLWQELKKRQIEAERSYEVREGRAAYEVDFAISCVQGALAVQIETGLEELPPLEKTWGQILRERGWKVLRFPVAELGEGLPRCVERIGREIDSLGGQGSDILEDRWDTDDDGLPR